MPWRTSDNREYFREYHARRRAEAIRFLGGKCSRCGSEEGLEFHHCVDEPDKLTVGPLLKGRWAVVLAEIAKCELLCKQCHCRESNNRLGFAPLDHGSYGMYRDKKCRCVLCKAENARRSREYKAKRKSGRGARRHVGSVRPR